MAKVNINVAHEIESPAYLCIEAILAVEFGYQAPSYSMYSAASDLDYYGGAWLDSVEVVKVVASDDNGPVELPQEYANLDPLSLWDEDYILQEAMAEADMQDEAARDMAADHRMEEMRERGC